VAQDVQYKKLVVIASDVRNKPATIVGDIEYHARSGDIAVSPALPNVREVPPTRCSRHLVPNRKRSFPLRMIRRRLSDFLPADNPHRSNLRILRSRCQPMDGKAL
jgi:hypothetical protein